jgi:hypothetical protein
MGIGRDIEIKADANPYVPAYARYSWYTRNRKGMKSPCPARSLGGK